MATGNNLQELYEKFLLGQSNATEQRELIALFGTSDTTVLEELILQKLEDNTAFAPENADHKKRYNRILVNLQQEISQNRISNRFKWLKIAAAASIMLAVGLSAYLFISNQNVKPLITTAEVKAEVRPGGNKALLILSNGKKIPLANINRGIIGVEAGQNIRKTAEGQIEYDRVQQNHSSNKGVNILQTPNGGEYRVVLPDGTRVWLNAASSLKYAVNFGRAAERRIELTGEAYFEVAKDAARPFIVQTDDQTIKVLGTHFNVNAYHDDGGSKTTLLEGSIRATYGNAKALVYPGQQVISIGRDRLRIDDVDTEIALAWKNNQFMFDSEPIRTLMKRLARWYDVDVVYGSNVPDVHFNGGVSKFENISAVLKILESTGKAHFKLKDRTIYIEQ